MSEWKSLTVWILELQNSTKTCKIQVYAQCSTPPSLCQSAPFRALTQHPLQWQLPLSCLTGPSVMNCHSPGLCSICVRWYSSAHIAFEWEWAKAFELNNSHADFLQLLFLSNVQLQANRSAKAWKQLKLWFRVNRKLIKGPVRDLIWTKVLLKLKDAGLGPSIASGRTQAQLAYHTHISLVR